MKNILITLTLILCVNIIHAQSHDNWKNYTYSQRVMAIDVDGDSIWISTMGGGLIKYTKHSPTTGEKTIYNRANANLPDNNLLGACNAGNGNVWVTAKYYGTGMLNDAGCTIFNQSNSGLPFDQYNTSVKVDNQGNVWIASSEWMTKYDGAEWKTWKTGSDLSAWPILSF